MAGTSALMFTHDIASAGDKPHNSGDKLDKRAGTTHVCRFWWAEPADIATALSSPLVVRLELQQGPLQPDCLGFPGLSLHQPLPYLRIHR